MDIKTVKLDLPEFAFVEGYKPGNILDGRTVILHVRSASVMEVFDAGDVELNDDVLYYKFHNQSKRYPTGPETMYIALHYCATLDCSCIDKQYIIENILKPAAIWYCDYCDWEDEQPDMELIKKK